jgi:hypothetical protein
MPQLLENAQKNTGKTRKRMDIGTKTKWMNSQRNQMTVSSVSNNNVNNGWWPNISNSADNGAHLERESWTCWPIEI